MFPDQRTGMLSFNATNEIEGDQNDDNITQDEIWSELDYRALDGSVGASNPSNSNNNRRKGGRGRKQSTSSSSMRNVEDDQQRKMIHREIERQRRQEMSNLCASLRSALPAEYLKGKRSTSDQLAEAVNYIKDLEKNVKELGDTRDKLKAASMESTSSHQQGGVGGSRNDPTPSPGTVVLLPRLGGLDVEINVAYEDEGFSLSTALQVILDEGLGIASYTSTKVDDRFVHNIVCEMDDMGCIDIDGLHQRLIFLVC